MAMGGGGKKPASPGTPFGGGGGGTLAGAIPVRPRPTRPPGGIGGGPPGMGAPIGPRAAPGAGVGAFAKGGRVEHEGREHDEVSGKHHPHHREIDGYDAKAWDHHARHGRRSHTIPDEHGDIKHDHVRREHVHREHVHRHAKGGEVEHESRHDDEKQDKKLFNRMFRDEEKKGEVVKKHAKGGEVSSSSHTNFKRGGPVLDRYITRKSSEGHRKEEGIHRGEDRHRGHALRGAGIEKTSTKMPDTKPRVGRHNHK